MDKLNVWQKRISLNALCFAFVVIILGAVTRLIDAGLGCPDWPGCYGYLTVISAEKDQSLEWTYPATPLVSYKAWAEMLHRYCAGILSLLILSLATVLGIRFVREKRLAFLALLLSLLALVTYQIMLGRWTVTLQLLPSIVTQHLLGGFLTIALLGLCYCHTYLKTGASFHLKKGFVWALIGVILLLCQIFLGAWTSTHYAALSCEAFPFCSEIDINMPFAWQEAFQWQTPIGLNYEGGLLSEVARQTIQMIHRIGAAVVFLYWFVFFLLINYKLTPKVLKNFYLILVLLLIQFALGIANAVFSLPLGVAVLHNVAAALLLLSAIFLTWQLAHNKQEISCK